MLRKNRPRWSQPGFDCGGREDAEIDQRRHPASSVFIKMLPFGIDRSLVNRLDDVGLRNRRSPKTGGDTKRQRANGNDNQHSTPFALTNLTMFQCEQMHVAVTGRLCFVGLYNTGRKAHVTSVMRFPSQLDTELGILVARRSAAPGRPLNSTRISRRRPWREKESNNA